MACWTVGLKPRKRRGSLRKTPANRYLLISRVDLGSDGSQRFQEGDTSRPAAGERSDAAAPWLGEPSSPETSDLTFPYAREQKENTRRGRSSPRSRLCAWFGPKGSRRSARRWGLDSTSARSRNLRKAAARAQITRIGCERVSRG